MLALIHALPALAFFRPALLTNIYGVEPGGTAQLLLHHRAALFLAMFILCVWSIFATGPRPAAVVVAALRMVSFLLLYRFSGSPPALRSIAVADLIGLAPLALVAWAVRQNLG